MVDAVPLAASPASEGAPQIVNAHVADLGTTVTRGSCSPSGISFAYELSANRFAVEAFQVWGMAGGDAVRSVVRQLVYTAKVRGRNQRPPHDFCAEAADVLRAYPASPDPRDPGDTTCQTEIASVRPTPKAGG